MNHFYQTIHGWSNFLPWYTEAVEEAEDDDNFAEIGVYRGRSSAFMGVEIANSGKDIHHYAIDSWTGKYDKVYEAARRALKPLNNVTVMRYASIQAAGYFKDLDTKFFMVNIDGDHSYLSCRQDIESWWPLIREGGWLMGDDYNGRYPGVNKAVQEFVSGKDLKIEVGCEDVEVPNNEWRIRKLKNSPL